MIKVICFCRVSTLTQDLENQRNEVLTVIKKDGYKANEVVIIEGKESAIKLDEEERQTLIELKESINTHPTIKDVYFYAIDRLARKVSVVLSIIDKMTALGINLHFLNPYPMQTLRDGKEDAMGKMFLTFLSIGAEMEMKMKKERFATARKMMKSEGKLVVGTVLYGYYRDKNGFPQKKEDEKKIVEYIFTEYLNGVSMRNIAKTLILNGTWDGTKFQSLNSGIMKVSNIITNPAYSGRTPKQFNSKEEKNIKYPAIVDAETQDKAIEISSSKKRPKETTNIYYAKGLVKTEVNGKYYVLSPSKGNASYCINGLFGISINVIDTIAWKATQQLHKIFQSYETFVTPQKYEIDIKDYQKQIDNLKPIFDNFKERKDRLTKVYTLGRFTDEEYEKEYDNIIKEEQPYINEKVRLENLIKRTETQLQQIKNKKEENVNYETMTDEEKKELCKFMIKEIIVVKTGKYNYDIMAIPSDVFRIGLVAPLYKYNVSGGKIRLHIQWKEQIEDISNEVVIRYKAPRRGKTNYKKKG